LRLDGGKQTETKSDEMMHAFFEQKQTGEKGNDTEMGVFEQNYLGVYIQAVRVHTSGLRDRRMSEKMYENVKKDEQVIRYLLRPITDAPESENFLC
jgi:hypothetical protein